MNKYDDFMPLTSRGPLEKPVISYFGRTPLELVNALVGPVSEDHVDIRSALHAWDLLIDECVFAGRVANLYHTPLYTTALNVSWNLLAYFDIDTRYDIVAHCVALSFNSIQTAAYISGKFLELKKNVDPPTNIHLFSI